MFCSNRRSIYNQIPGLLNDKGRIDTQDLVAEMVRRHAGILAKLTTRLTLYHENVSIITHSLLPAIPGLNTKSTKSFQSWRILASIHSQFDSTSHFLYRNEQLLRLPAALNFLTGTSYTFLSFCTLFIGNNYQCSCRGGSSIWSQQ